MESSLGVKYPTRGQVLCLLQSVQDEWMLNHSIQNQTTAAQSTEKPLLQNTPEGATFVIYLGNKSQFQIQQKGRFFGYLEAQTLQSMSLQPLGQHSHIRV